MAIKGCKYRVYPDDAQKVLLARTFGCNRFIWNNVLSALGNEYNLFKEGKGEKPNTSSVGLAYRPTLLKVEYPWLSEASSVSLQQTMRDLGVAFNNFFKGKGYPKFKKKGGYDSYRLTKTGFRLKDGDLHIAGSKTRLKVKWSRGLPSEPSSVTISKTPSGKYYASFTCDYQSDIKCKDGKVGIDLGIKDFATMSNGKVIPNPRHYKKFQKKLAYLQKSLSRKKKGSNRRQKAKLKVARCHEKIANVRNDFLHKLSTTLTSENQAICVEMLYVKGMIQNKKLSKHIADVSWGAFLNMLTYKSKDTGTKIIRAERFFPSSKLCSSCGFKYSDLKLSERSWVCNECGTKHDRDLNAAVNLELLLSFSIKAFPDTQFGISGLNVPVIKSAFNNHFRRAVG